MKQRGSVGQKALKSGWISETGMTHMEGAIAGGSFELQAICC